MSINKHKRTYNQNKENYLNIRSDVLTGGNIKNNFTKKIDKILENTDGNYGILISKNNKVIYEKYVNNDKNTRFRVFSCSKPITGMAIMLLVQNKKLKLTDTIDKFCINIPHNDKISIMHLLQHSSGIYDISSELYFKL